MCFIFTKPEGITFPFDIMELAFNRNGDGFGLMFWMDGKVHQRVLLPNNFGQVKKMYLRHHKNPIAVHFRTQTVGKIQYSAVHPFKVLDRKRDGIGMYMMHNGTLTTRGIKNGLQNDESDSLQLVKNYLRPILKDNPNLIHSKAFQHILAGLIGSGNRLVFLDDTGEMVYINKESGYSLEDDKVWISNLYAIAGYDKLGYSFSGTDADLIRREVKPIVEHKDYSYYPVHPLVPSISGTPSKMQGHLSAYWASKAETKNPAKLVMGSTLKVHPVEHNNDLKDDEELLKTWFDNQNDYTSPLNKYTETAMVYTKTLELIEDMTENEMFQWVLCAPEEASFFAYNTLNPPSTFESKQE